MATLTLVSLFFFFFFFSSAHFPHFKLLSQLGHRQNFTNNPHHGLLTTHFEDPNHRQQQQQRQRQLRRQLTAKSPHTTHSYNGNHQLNQQPLTHHGSTTQQLQQPQPRANLANHLRLQPAPPRRDGSQALLPPRDQPPKRFRRPGLLRTGTTPSPGLGSPRWIPSFLQPGAGAIQEGKGELGKDSGVLDLGEKGKEKGFGVRKEFLGGKGFGNRVRVGFL